jgi:hypothetical protein
VLAIRAHNYDIDHSSFTLVPRLLSTQFTTVDESDYGTEVKMVDGLPELDENLEPEYTLPALTRLKDNLLAQTPVRQTDIDRMDQRGLEDFIDYLEASTKNAGLYIDFGYLRLRTEIYRVRQFVLGNVEATKLATSPVLAEFAKGETAYATRKDITDFMEKLQESAGESIGSGGPKGTTPGSGGDGSGGIKAEKDLIGRATKIIPSGAKLTGSISRGPEISSKTTVFDRATDKVIKDAAIKQTLGTPALHARPRVEKIAVEEQSPIVGLVPEFHNATVGKRLKQPIASDAKAGGIAVKAEIIDTFRGTDINLDGIEVPGFRDSSTGNEETRTFENIKNKDIDDIKRGIHDINPKDKYDNIVQEDESAFFSAGVRALENASAVLMGVEGRVQAYRNAIDRCKDTLAELKKNLTATDERLKVIHNELAEARHDVTVSRTLRDEERKRVDALNARRDEIINDHVPFFLFRRPRVTDALLKTPVLTLNPDLSDTPLPVCAASDAETPEEISAMMDILRDAPLKWFSTSETVLKHLNRLPELQATVKGATQRAKALTGKYPYLQAQAGTLDNIGRSMANALFASQKLVADQRRRAAGFDVSVINAIGWIDTAAKAREVISLADIMDGNHGRFHASRQASQALADIARTATCLYLRFGQVLPSIRLDWAERLSQFDAPITLRNLYSLPRWNEIDFVERKELQMLVDSLFQRIRITESNAVQLINDLIRICILLASHAPVNRILAGRIPEPAIVQKGTQVDIVTDVSRVRVGMAVLMQAGFKMVAKGVVEDIDAGRVKARIQEASEKTLALGKDAKVQIAEPRTLGSLAVSREQKAALAGVPTWLLP